MKGKNRVIQRIFAVLQVLVISLGLVFDSIPLSVKAGGVVDEFNVEITNISPNYSEFLKGAEVKVDGKQIIEYKSDAIVIENIKIGVHKYIISKDGLQVASGEIKIEALQTTITVDSVMTMPKAEKYQYLMNRGNVPDESDKDWNDILVNKNNSEEPIINLKISNMEIYKNNKYWFRAANSDEFSSCDIKVTKVTQEEEELNDSVITVGGSESDTPQWYMQLPEVTINKVSVNADSKNTYYKIWNTLKGETEDGVKITNFDFDGANKFTINKDKISDGINIIKVWTLDKNGNEISIEKKIFVDTNGPSDVGIEYIGENISNREIDSLPYDLILREKNQESNVKIRISVKDASTVVRIKYKIGDYEEKTKEGKGIIQGENGQYYCEDSIDAKFKGKILVISATDYNNHTFQFDAEKNVIVEDDGPTVPIVAAKFEGPIEQDRVNWKKYDNKWTNKNINIQIGGSTAASGIEEYQYCINDGEEPNEKTKWAKWEVVSLGTVSKDTNKTYWFRAKSYSERYSDPVSCKIQVRKTPPKNPDINISKEGLNKLGWYTKVPNVLINNIEFKTYYKLWNIAEGQNMDSCEKIQISSPSGVEIDKQKISNGKYILYAWSEDEAGNKSEGEQKSFNVDSISPSFDKIEYEYSIEAYSYIQKTLNAITFDLFFKKDVEEKVEDVKVKIYATDNLSGVSEVKYHIVDATSDCSSEGSIKFENQEKYKEVSIGRDFKGEIQVDAVIDVAGNVADLPIYNSSRNIITEDEEPTKPTIIATTEDGLSYDGTNKDKYTNKDINIKIEGSTALSGIEYYEYCSTDNNKEPIYGQKWTPIAINVKSKIPTVILKDVEINKTYHFRAVSEAGAHGKVESLVVQKDSKAASSPKIIAKTGGKDYKIGNWANGNVEISVSGSTALSGISYYEYGKQDSNNEIKWTEIKTEDENKIPTVILDTEEINKIYYFRAVSKSGVHGESNSLVVQKDSKPASKPNIGATTDGKAYESDNWASENVEIRVSGSKALSGISYYEYGTLDSSDEIKWTKITTEDENKIPTVIVDDKEVNKIYYFRAVSISGVHGESNSLVVQKDSNLALEPTINAKMYQKNSPIGQDCETNKWINQDGILNIISSGSTAFSGISYYEYGIIDLNGQMQWTPIKIDDKNKIPTVIVDSKEINKTYYFRAVSKSGVHGKMSDFVVKIDSVQPEPPQITATKAEGSYNSGKWTKEDVNISLSDSTTFSGIAEYQYCINDGTPPEETEWRELSSKLEDPNAEDITVQNRISNVQEITTDTDKTYWYRAISNSGLVSDAVSYTVKVQKTPPMNASVHFCREKDSTKDSVDDLVELEDRGGDWYNYNPIIKIKKPRPTLNQTLTPGETPKQSSVPIKTYYKFSKIESVDKVETVVFEESEKNIKINEDGKYKLEVWTVDNATNECINRITKYINVDTTNPKNFNIQYIEEQEKIDNSTIRSFLNKMTFGVFFNKKIDVRIYGQDNLSGINRINYHIEALEGSEKLTEDIFENDKEKEKIKECNIKMGSDTEDKKYYYVQFSIVPQYKGKIVLDSVIDNAGNTIPLNGENETYEHVVVDSLKPTAPTINVDGQDKAAGAIGEWTNKQVDIIIDRSKALSGIAEYQYCINDGTSPAETEWRELSSKLEDPNAEDITVQNRISNVQEITTDTDKTYWYRAISNSGLVSDAVSYTVKVQKTPPMNASVHFCREKDSTKDSVDDLVELEDRGGDWYNYNPIIKIKKPRPTLNQTLTPGETPKQSSVPIKTYYKFSKIESVDKVETVVFEESEKNIKINEDGKYKLEVWTVDNATNECINRITKYINVDTTNPKNFNIQYIEEQEKIDNSTIRSFLNKMTFGVFFNKKIDVRIYGQDNLSGINRINYHIEALEGSEKLTEDIFENDKEKEKIKECNIKMGSDTEDKKYYYVQFSIVPQYKGKIVLDSVIDNAGNTIPLNGENETYEHVVVDSLKPTAPTINVDGQDKAAGAIGEWTNKQVDIIIDRSKALSGIAEYQYCINDGTPPVDTDWSKLTSELKNPNAEDITVENRISKVQNITTDTNKTYWYRAVSNSGLVSDEVSYKVQVQKTIPQNANVSYEEPNEEGWYKTIPTITLINPTPTVTPSPSSAPIIIYYKLWNTSNGETETDSNVVVFNGSNPPTITTDGEYTFKIWTQDVAGNRSAANMDIVRDIKVDLNSPQVSVNYDNNETLNSTYFKETRVATITVNEKNFEPSKAVINVIAKDNGAAIAAPNNSDWTSNGNLHTTSLPFTTDGDYTIDVTCKDKADNISSELEQQLFTIDLTEPKVEISSITDLSANKEAVKPIISYSDTNLDLDKVNISLEGNKSGVVQLEGGNGTTENGQTFTFNPIEEDDNYILSAKIVDKAGNEISKKVSFSVNQKGSTFEFNQKDIMNKYTNKSFIPQIQVSNVDEVTIMSLTVNGKSQDYTFENGLITFADEINTDGKYVIGLDVKDAAGNMTSMQPIEFFYDNTSPKVFMDGVEEGGVYLEKVNITVKPDNVNDIIKEVVLNDKILLEGEYTVNDDRSLSMELADYKKYKLEVLAVDQAGNTNNYQDMSFEITDNIFVKFYMNKPLFYGTVGVASAVSVAGILFSLFGKGALLIK